MMLLAEFAALQIVLPASLILGGTAGMLGSFAVLRRQSLLGDAVSHAALPGVAIGFLLFGNQPLGILFAAAVAGWLALAGVDLLLRWSGLPFDTLLAGMLSVTFGLGLLLMSWIQRNAAGASTSGLDRYLFGQAATMLREDLLALTVFAGLSVAILLLLWKELKLVTFDPEFAAAAGYPVRFLEGLRTGLLVLATVIGLQSVGVVMMSAMIVAPAVAARHWTDRFGRMIMLAALLGAGFSVAGVMLSDQLRIGDRSVPTGPTIVICATVGVLLSVLKRRLFG